MGHLLPIILCGIIAPSQFHRLDSFRNLIFNKWQELLPENLSLLFFLNRNAFYVWIPSPKHIAYWQFQSKSKKLTILLFYYIPHKNVLKNTFWNKDVTTFKKPAEIINCFILLFDHPKEKSEFMVFKRICENYLEVASLLKSLILSNHRSFVLLAIEYKIKGFDLALFQASYDSVCKSSGQRI